MRRILKYPLERLPSQTVKLPGFAGPLSVKCIRERGMDQLVLYAIICEDVAPVERTVRLYATGEPMMPGTIGTYLGTVIDSVGIVFHAFIL